MGLRRHPADPEVVFRTDKMVERSCSLHPVRVGLSKCKHIGHVEPTVTVEPGPPAQLQDGRIVSVKVCCGGVTAHHHQEALGGEERREGGGEKRLGLGGVRDSGGMNNGERGVKRLRGW